jgi:uncharacterized protein YkwD
LRVRRFQAHTCVALAAVLAGAALTATAAAAAAAGVVVSELQTDGNGTSDEFVELANASSVALDVSGWELRFLSSGCSDMHGNARIAPGTTLAPGQRHLFAGTGYTGSVPGDAAFPSSNRLASYSGAVRLLDAAGAVVDEVGYGDPAGSADGVRCGEGAPAPSPPVDGSIERIGGVRDTGDNGADFRARAVPDPQNADSTRPSGTSPPEVPPAAAGPTVAVALLPERPRVGERATLVVRGRQPALPTAHLELDFGEPGGQGGVSACQLRRFSRQFALGRETRFRLHHVFARPGAHEVTVAVSSGGCRGARYTTVQTLPVDVAPATSARASAAPAPRIGAVAARCGGADSPVAGTTRRRAASAIVCLMNQVRRRRGLRVLRPSRGLARAALAHSRDMTRRRYFDHVGPGGPTLVERLRRARYRLVAAGESLGWKEAATPRRMVDDWIGSPPHFANMVSRKFRFAGIGIVTAAPNGLPVPGVATFTVDFGRTR